MEMVVASGEPMKWSIARATSIGAATPRADSILGKWAPLGPRVGRPLAWHSFAARAHARTCSSARVLRRPTARATIDSRAPTCSRKQNSRLGRRRPAAHPPIGLRSVAFGARLASRLAFGPVASRCTREAAGVARAPTQHVRARVRRPAAQNASSCAHNSLAIPHSAPAAGMLAHGCCCSFARTFVHLPHSCTRDFSSP